MTTLALLQQKFLTDIYDIASKQLIDHITPHPLISSAHQLTIYRNSIFGRLQKALRAIYPVCYKLVGHDFFTHMASIYIQQTPSVSPNLNTYGAHFTPFIAQYQPAATLPYLPDVASLEWAWHQLYGAPDSIQFDFNKLSERSAINGEDICFILPERSSLLTSPYPIDQIWESNQPGFDEAFTLSLNNNQTNYFFVWHCQHVFHITPLNKVEWQLLTWFQESVTLEIICERAALQFPDTNITELLPQFIKNGWLVDFI
jgi:hypothetical protein